MGGSEHNFGDCTLVEAAGRVALAQAHLDVILRMAIETVSKAGLRETLDATKKLETRELGSELRAQFRARCKDAAMRTKLRAILIECERLCEQRQQLSQNAWTIAEDGSVLSESSQRPFGAPATVAALNSLAAEMMALGAVLNNARLHGFIASVAAQGPTGDVVPVPSPAPQHQEPSSEALPAARPIAPVMQTVEASHIIAARGQATVLEPRAPARLAVLVCPNCQAKVVST